MVILGRGWRSILHGNVLLLLFLPTASALAGQVSLITPGALAPAPLILPGGPLGPVVPGAVSLGHASVFVTPWITYVSPGYETPRRSPYDFEFQAAGRLRLQVEPPDAQVLLDGSPLATEEPGMFELGLFVGEHTLLVHHPHYQPRSLDVAIEAAKTSTVRILLKKH